MIINYIIIAKLGSHRLKKKPIIVKTSSGDTINESDLISSIKRKKISNAALDVFYNEPISKKNKLLKFKNIVKNSHTVGALIEAVYRTSIGSLNGIFSKI
jgi:lactate dehydrogenase-like 2-hydroxyacid dehydrogenase